MIIISENKRIICRVFIVSVLLLTTMGSQCRGDNQVNEMDSEMKKALQLLEKLISKEIITEGGFEELKIGQQKSAVIPLLRDMGIHVVSPDVKDVITVKKASELYKVKDAESLILREGIVWITFDKDNVKSVRIPPYSEWVHRFESIATREDVFNLLADVLQSDPKAYVRNLATDSRQIVLDKMTNDDELLLKKYDAWEMGRDNEAGRWHFRLEFDNDILKKITVQHSPVELP